jgi:hypothetical protein
MLEEPILLYMMVTENDKSLRALAAAACLLSMPIISKILILEIERIIMTEKKNLSTIQ